MFSKISVPLDGSKLAEQILPFVRVFAAPRNIPVDLFTVRNPQARPPFWPPELGEPYLEQIRGSYFSAEAPVTCEVKTGDPAEVIIESHRGDPHCLIAMSTHGMSGLHRWLMGSITRRVVQHAANPLLIIRPVEAADPALRAELKTVFVPLDGSGLAERIVPEVLALAKDLKLEVQLVRAYILPAEAYVVGDGVVAQGGAQYKAQISSEVETYLEGKAEALRAEGLDNVIATALQGDAASEIIDLACRTDRNLIAMCTHGRSGVGRWLLGSVAEKVIQHSRDPVLLIRAT